MNNFYKSLVDVLKVHGKVRYKQAAEDNNTFPIIIYDPLNLDMSAELDNKYLNKDVVVRITISDDTDASLLAENIEKDLLNNFTGVSLEDFRDVTEFHEGISSYVLDVRFFNITN